MSSMIWGGTLTTRLECSTWLELSLDVALRQQATLSGWSYGTNNVEQAVNALIV